MTTQHVLFDDCFRDHPDGTFPDGWEVERHSDFAHDHGCVANGAYSILVEGNRHLPLIPPLKNFTLTVRCRAQKDFASKASLWISFHYDPSRGSGHRIRLTWGADGAEILYGEEHAGVFQEWDQRLLKEPSYDVGVPLTFRLTVLNELWSIDVDGRHLSTCTQRQAMDPAAGRIAFDRNKGLGHLWLEQVRIESDGRPASEVIWPASTVTFPAQINGMEIPYRLRYEAAQEPGRAILTTRIEGGIHEKAPGSTLGYFYEEETLRGPYVRVEKPGGQSLGQYYLLHGTLGPVSQQDPREPDGRRHDFTFYPATAEVPHQASTIFPSIPPSAALIFGYDYFCRELAFPLAGGPSEMMVDPLSGKVLYAGAALPPGSVVLEITSPPDKAICGLIPADLPRRNEALDFARANHYFIENEPVRFTLIVRCRDASLTLPDLRLSAQLQNVYQDPLGERTAVALAESGDDMSQTLRERLGARTFQGEVSFGNLPTGVYHLAAELCLGPRQIVPQTKAFEVLSLAEDALAPPQASGLPELHSFMHEWRDIATDTFDPWLGQGVNAGHYMASNCFAPAVARARRSWELTRLYRRQWMLALWGRSTTTPAPEQNADLIPHSDLIWIKNGRLDLHVYASYHGETLDVLRRFLNTLPGLQGPLADFAATTTGEFSRAAFQQLVHDHWKAWIRWACQWVIAEWAPQQRRPLEALNPQAHRLSYAFVPMYASSYKSAYFSTHNGIDLALGWERLFDGPMFYEDYPFACGYPIQRGLYLFITMKLEAPELQIIPEFYAGGVCVPTDGALLYGNPPCSYFNVPSRFFRKRLFEFACATAWFGKDGFHYWNDQGFHGPMWRQEHYEAFLGAWKQISQHQPAKPLRTAAFVYSRRVCEAHADFLDQEGTSSYKPEGDIYNTAEECIPFAYEQSRVDGQLAGVVADMEYIDALSADDVHTLVLPPLCGLMPRQINAIRRLHENGVSLMAFESVDGLEDLFGVKRVESPVRVREISVNARDASSSPSAELAGLTEHTHHPLCVSAYAADQARTVLVGHGEPGDANAAVLVVHETRWGRTALFTVPPTVVRRNDLRGHAYNGRPSISPLINRAMATVLRWLAKPVATTSAGKLIGFRDHQGQINLIVTEDAFPEQARPILPLVTLNVPLSPADPVRCDRPFTIVARSRDSLALRLSLDPHDSAWITIAPASGG